jgi:hypothetical protein
MTDAAGLDSATSLFVHHLSTKNTDWLRIPTKQVSIPAGRVQAQDSGASFDASRAQQLAETWGFDFLGEFKESNRTYWRAKRKDAPPVDIIGGPSRSIVRQIPRARLEAARVQQECGVDVMDPQACYDVENAAGEAAAGGFSGWLGATSLWAVGMGLCYFGVMFLGYLPVSIPLCVLGVAAIITGFRPAVSGHRRKKAFKEDHLPKVEAIRRVVHVAEEELAAGWRPDTLPS